MIFFEAGELVSDVRVADLNHDGTDDVVSLGFHGSVTVFLGNGDGVLTMRTNFFGCCRALEIGDFNGDENPDLIVIQPGYEDLFFGNGDGTFTYGGYLPLAGGAWAVAVGDVNGDRQLDMVIGGRGSFQVLLNQTFTRLQTQKSNNDLELSWPSFTAGFVLESASDLHSPDNWQRVPLAPVVSGNRYVVPVTPTGAKQFYRLRRQ